jgi:hypothetical protein
MFRISMVTIALVFAAAATAQAQQFPPQPAPAEQGNPQERAACHPDVSRYCQAQLKTNADDVLGILACLQQNRAKISKACQEVLASHGQ